MNLREANNRLKHLSLDKVHQAKPDPMMEDWLQPMDLFQEDFRRGFDPTFDTLTEEEQREREPAASIDLD